MDLKEIGFNVRGKDLLETTCYCGTENIHVL